MTGFFFVVVLGLALIAAVVILMARHHGGLQGPEWESGVIDTQERRRREHTQRYGSLIEALASIREHDPEFSFVLFEDFLHALYVEAHTARGQGRLEALSPYLAAPARGALEGLGEGKVRTVIVGSLRVGPVTVGGLVEPTEAGVDVEASYAEIDAQGVEHAYYVTERWTLTRAPGARSRAPARARIIDCPSCGAPLDKIIGGTCGYCNKDVDEGGFDWTVQSIESLAREPRPPVLTGTVEEVGHDDPTIFTPDVKERWAALTARDPALDWSAFTGRIDLVFRTFQEAWTKQEPLRVRPFLSDNLFQTQLYWIDAYRQQGLVNRTDGAHIMAVHLCRVVSDARFDAVTVRVFATGLDYTVNAQGEVVGGNRKKERPYSEYWTLIRGTDRSGAPRVTPECPSCGAGLEVNMAGACKFCSAKVSTGEFDWVLSRIEQDEVYG